MTSIPKAFMIALSSLASIYPTLLIENYTCIFAIKYFEGFFQLLQGLFIVLFGFGCLCSFSAFTKFTKHLIFWFKYLIFIFSVYKIWQFDYYFLNLLQNLIKSKSSWFYIKIKIFKLIKGLKWSLHYELFHTRNVYYILKIWIIFIFFPLSFKLQKMWAKWFTFFLKKNPIN